LLPIQQGWHFENIQTSSEVLEENKRAVVVFTRGPHFDHVLAGNGQTGKWHVNPSSWKLSTRSLSIYGGQVKNEPNFSRELCGK
jgi:hypothetical protein